MSDRLINTIAALVAIAAIAACAMLGFRFIVVTHVENYELGYLWDARDGSITRIQHPGYIIHPPIVTYVYTIDLRPMQVCINANKRTLNCKLVRFNPAGLDKFLEWHGTNDYAINGTNADGRTTTGGLDDILMSYAFDGSRTRYPFLEVLGEISANGEKPITDTVPTTTAPIQAPQ